jgi:hypothetical protein
MTEKPKPKHDDPEQSKRFIETARKIGADETEKGADRAFKQATSSKPKANRSRPSGRTASS